MTTITLTSAAPFIPSKPLGCECSNPKCSAHPRRRLCKSAASSFVYPRLDATVAEASAACADCAEFAYSMGDAYVGSIEDAIDDPVASLFLPSEEEVIANALEAQADTLTR